MIFVIEGWFMIVVIEGRGMMAVVIEGRGMMAVIEGWA